MGYLHQGDSDCEPALACLVMEQVHCSQCARSTAQKGKPQEYRLGDAPCIHLGKHLVNGKSKECQQRGYGNYVDK